MKTDIWLPLYVGDYLADTSHLSNGEHGSYLLLLMHEWRTGPLPDDEALLMRVAKMSPDAWSNAWPMLSRFFQRTSDGYLIQSRLEMERDKSLKRKEGAAEKATKAAQARWSKDASSNASSIPGAMLELCPSPSSSQETNTSPKKPDSLREAVEGVYEYYLAAVGRTASAYKLDSTRLSKGRSRLTELLSGDNDLQTAVGMLKSAVDGLARNDWAMGRDPKTNGKRYCNWESHLMKDQAQLQGWIEAGRPKTSLPSPQPSLLDQMNEQKRRAAAQ